MMKSLKFTF